jgi:high-affinity K+ transport system ATPase subunit B
VRDGVIKSVPVKSLVPGHVVKLRTGDLVPADGIVLEAQGVPKEDQIAERWEQGMATQPVQSGRSATNFIRLAARWKVDT